MDYKAEDIFIPGQNIDIVFNINSLSPVSRHSMIFDSDPGKKELIISQTKPFISHAFSYETMHITTLKSEPKNDKIRIGARCEIKEFIDDYRLNREQKEQAIRVTYSNKLHQVNIRSAFRIRPNKIYSIIAKLLYKNEEFLSGKHFKIFDISLSGIGLLVPNVADKNKNPLIKLETGDKAKIGLILKEPGEDEESEPVLKKVFNKIKIVRINKKFNPRYILIGCEFADWERNQEEDLGKFIHQLQLYEIRNFQKY
jgi:c-di-GMP-binding flagellar brake protein YcgR